MAEVYRQSVAALETVGKPFEIIFVDDGSTDGTWSELERLNAEDAQVQAVRFKRNFGQHPAMHAGLSRARGDVIVTMDGDLQNSPGRPAEADRGRRGRRGRRERPRAPSRATPGAARCRRSSSTACCGASREPTSPISAARSTPTRATAITPSSASSASRSSRRRSSSRPARAWSRSTSTTERAGPLALRPLRLTRLALHVLAGFWPQPIQWAGVLIGVPCSLLARLASASGASSSGRSSDFPGCSFSRGSCWRPRVQGFILALVGSTWEDPAGRRGRPLYTIDQELVDVLHQARPRHRRRRVHPVEPRPPPARWTPYRSCRSTRSRTRATSTTSRT